MVSHVCQQQPTLCLQETLAKTKSKVFTSSFMRVLCRNDDGDQKQQQEQEQEQEDNEQEEEQKVCPVLLFVEAQAL